MEEIDEVLLQVLLVVCKYLYLLYLGYVVGVVIFDEQGCIYVGVNIENVVYLQGWCVEVMVFGVMVMVGGWWVVVVLVIGFGFEVIMFCGGCCQKLCEFVGFGLCILVGDLGGIWVEWMLEDLLLYSFGLDYLNLYLDNNKIMI